MGLLVSSTVPGLFNGVSQQAATMRLDSQGDIQENALGTIVDGLIKRPNSEHVALFTSTGIEDAAMHVIDRDLEERYQVMITNSETEPIEIYKLDGTKCAVRYGTLDTDLVFTEELSVKAYLGTSQALTKAYKLMSIADYTIIVNRSKVTAATEDLSPGTVTDRVQTFLDLPNEWEKVQAYDNTKTYTKGDLAKWTDRKVYYYINDTDGAGVAPPTNTHWREEYTFASNDEIYEVTGDPGNNFDNYYVKFNDGAWGECLAPGFPYRLDPATMPHRLVRTDVNQFTFAPCLWEDRVVGDDDSCPMPSFIGKAITNLTFFKNRLGFIAGDTLFFSRAGRYFELFGETAMDLLDDDPIDALASASNVVQLYSSIPFDKALLVCAAQGQYTFGSSGANLIPQTATITPSTAYVTSPDSDPVGAGANVYFVNPRERFVSIMEYLIQPDTLVEDASDITAHCPHYVPNGAIKLMSCVPMDMIIAFSDSDRQSLYVYKYYWVGNEKPQSAWCKWTFDGTILGVGLIDTMIFMVIKRGTQVCFEKIQLENIATNPDFTFRVNLDRQVRVTGVYNAGTGKTTWTLPYHGDATEMLRCINPGTGFPIPLESISGNTAVAVGRYDSAAVTFGVPFKWRYRFSEWYVKDQKKASMIDAKLQIRSLTLSFKNTGPFQLEVTPQGRQTIVKQFTGVKIGSSKIGSPNLLTGEEKFSILSKSKFTTIDLVSDSHLPCQITSAAWEGFLVQRSQKV